MKSMIRSQKFLIIADDYSTVLAEEIAKENGCVAYFAGIPARLMHIATIEGWILPHVYTETWDDPDPVE
jgi:hypothetical protein